MDDVTQRNILLPALAPDQHVIQVIGILSLRFRRTDDNRQQVGALAI